MLKNFVKIFGGDPNKKTIEQFRSIAQQINSLEPQFEALTDEALRLKTDEFRARIHDSLGNVEGLEEKEQFKAYQDALEEILPEAFAAVRAHRPAQTAGGFEQDDFDWLLFRPQLDEPVRRGEAADAPADDDDAPSMCDFFSQRSRVKGSSPQRHRDTAQNTA